MEEAKSPQGQAAHNPVPFTEGIQLNDLESLSQNF